jgi:hypothetical protein
MPKIIGYFITELLPLKMPKPKNQKQNKYAIEKTKTKALKVFATSSKTKAL